MEEIIDALLALFGPDQVLTIEEMESFEGTRDKVMQYTSDLPRGQPGP